MCACFRVTLNCKSLDRTGECQSSCMIVLWQIVQINVRMCYVYKLGVRGISAFDLPFMDFVVFYQTSWTNLLLLKPEQLTSTGNNIFTLCRVPFYGQDWVFLAGTYCKSNLPLVFWSIWPQILLAFWWICVLTRPLLYSDIATASIF